MLCSSSFFDQCSPSYKIELQKLNDSLAKIDNNNNEEKQKILETFSSKFLMPKEYWKLLSELALNKSDEKELINSQNAFTPPAIYQFYFDRKNGMFFKNEQCYRKLLKFRGKIASSKLRHIYEFIEKDISFPHCHIKKRWRQYEESSCALPEMQVYKTYQKMRALYSKIKASESDVEKWFSLLLESDDEEFICHNVEYRLGGNLHNLPLWKLYFAFLKDTNPQEMLHLYSKYCRFFLDDLEMKEQYESEVKEFGPIIVSWENPFDFESHELPEPPKGGKAKEEVPSFSYKELFAFHKSEKNLPKNVFDDFLSQDFSFPRVMIHHVLQNSTHILLRRLFASCKYFYAKKLTPICYKFELTEYPTNADFYKETFQIDFNYSISSDVLKKFHITTSLTALYNETMDAKHFSQIIPKLHQCDAKFIWITGQTFTFDEFKFLVGHGKVLTLCLPGVNITNSKNNKPVYFEDVMALLPKIQELLIERLCCNFNTAEILANQTFYEKFEDFHISDICGDPFDPTAFRLFFTKNMNKNFKLFLTFEKFNDEFETEMKQVMADEEHFSEKVRKLMNIYFKGR